MFRDFLSLAVILTFASFVGPPAARAVQPADSLLPDTTKGYLSIPDMDALRESWNQTQLGELARDPAMKPFADDLQRQLKERLSESGVRLAITVDDLEGVYGGEICMAMVQPGNEKTAHSVVLLVDVTGHLDKANALLAKIDQNQRDKGATKQQLQVGGTTVIVYTLPKRQNDPVAERAYYFLRDNQLAASDQENVVRGILAKLDGQGGTALAGVPAFRETMTRCAQRSGEVAPQVKWFVEPFGYIETMRAAQGGRKRRGTDLLKVLRNQGFDAVTGVGGFVTLAVGDDEILHRTAIYAPPVAGAAAGEKFKLAARMLDFGQGQDLTPPQWVPREVATYLGFTWKMKEAFYHSETLVNEVMDDEVFKEVIDNIRDDIHGPQIDIRKDLVAHLGTRGYLLSDYQLPITPQSERLLVAVEMKDPTPAILVEFTDRDANGNGKITEDEMPKSRRLYFRRLVKKFDADGDRALNKAEYIRAYSIDATLEMAMENDPEARRIEVNDHVIWEIINKPDQAANVPKIEIGGFEGIEGFEGFEGLEDLPTFDSAGGVGNVADEAADGGESDEPLFPNSAVTYVHGHVMVSTHVDMLIKLLETAGPGDLLRDAEDYKQVTKALQRLGATEDNFRLFSRTDEAYRATFELFKQGKMPEAETLLAKVLNRMLGSGEEGVVREQQIDASKLPDYQIVRRYLGPAGFYVNAEPTGDGWFVVGTLLRK